MSILNIARDGSRGAFGFSLLAATLAHAQPVTITVDPSKITHELTPYMTGVCLEDVNHEIYGGLYSQMIYGESFQEPPRSTIKGFEAFDGEWAAERGVLRAGASRGAKLLFGQSVPDVTAIRVRLRFTDRGEGNAGLVVNVRNPSSGADAFDGYEISLDPSGKLLRLARHDHDYKLVRDVPCAFDPEGWTTLAAEIKGNRLRVVVNGAEITSFEHERVAEAGGFGVRTWLRSAEFRDLEFARGGSTQTAEFEPSASRVSGMWETFSRKGAKGAASLRSDTPFVGRWSQRVSRQAASEPGTVFGIENRGLNRSGIGIVAGRTYVGQLWARADLATPVEVSFASTDGSAVHAAAALTIDAGDWKRYDFTLAPASSDPAARFEIGLPAAGVATFGSVYVVPEPKDCFAGLPVRRDVAEALKAQSPKVIRYGGSMINSDEYRWKKMIGERAKRPPYSCVWDPHATNGWGIPDFLNFAEAMGVLAIPAFNINESPQDMLDFLEYANGDVSTHYGATRAADGHPAPYTLTHLELGNEERVDETYFKKFEATARAIWAKDPKIVLTVGDFCYTKPITDPFKFEGADSGITTLAAHRKILALAKELGTEVWFDLHIWTNEPVAAGGVRPWKTYIDRIEELAQGAKHKVVVYELNANTHTQRRALANAQILMELQRDGRVPVVASANCLQVDGQNDDGWDQGLIFMNTMDVWLQPPSMVWEMVSRGTYSKVATTSVSAPGVIDALATVSSDGNEMAVQILNFGDTPRAIEFSAPPTATAAGVDLDFGRLTAVTLAAPLDARNTAKDQNAVRITPLNIGLPFEVPAHSLTIVRMRLR